MCCFECSFLTVDNALRALIVRCASISVNVAVRICILRLYGVRLSYGDICVVFLCVCLLFICVSERAEKCVFCLRLFALRLFIRFFFLCACM